MDRTQVNHFNDFHSLVKESHHLPTDMPFTVSYTDPRNGDLLPINNDDNLMRAFTTAMPLLRLFIYRKQGGEHHADCLYVAQGFHPKGERKGGVRGGQGRGRSDMHIVLLLFDFAFPCLLYIAAAT